MDVEFLLGPAGTGKTHRCLAEIRAELIHRPEGAPLIFLAPKQATFQLERQLLADATLPGFTRLQILSFPRLAHFLHDALGEPEPRLIDETGRIMVLRALLRRQRDAFEIFRRSATQPGFAQELSRQWREFQEQGLTPGDLEAAAASPAIPPALAGKLRDTARLARAYAAWLQERGLSDPDALLDTAAALLTEARRHGKSPRIGAVWLDGFAEMTPQELRLLTELAAAAERSTIAFCLEDFPSTQPEPLSPWSGIGDTFQRAYARLSQLPGARLTVTRLPRVPARSRFSAAPFLQHIETNWCQPKPPTAVELAPTENLETVPSALELRPVDSVEAEALLAAYEVQSHVARGGRYRDCAVLLRSLDGHGDVFRRTWRRLGLPFFLDRREPVGSDPLTNLTRCALQLVADGWSPAHWFGALRTGLAGIELEAVDALENLTLSHGWDASDWTAGSSTIAPTMAPKLWIRAFEQFATAAAGEPYGEQIVTAISALWNTLGVAATLEAWDGAVGGSGLGRHQTVHRQMEAWLEEVQRALGTTAMSAAHWLEVFESAWLGLTVGLVPPALDQVLIGAIDRSRNPDLQRVILSGWNEGIFPQGATVTGLLTDSERRWLLTGNATHPLRLPQVVPAARESFLAYIGLTRATQRVVVTWVEAPPPAAPRSPLIARLLRLGAVVDPNAAVTRAVDLWRIFLPGPEPAPEPAAGTEHLSVELTEALLGRSLRLSASRLERFALCPHQAFLQDILRVREREVAQFEALEQGDLAHQVLAEYHRRVEAEGGSWAERDATVIAARLHAAATAIQDRDGSASNPRRRFAEGRLFAQLLRFLEQASRWMSAYPFRPAAAELEFGGRSQSGLPPLRLEFLNGLSISLVGKIDRLDRGIDSPDRGLVVDYKSRDRKWDQRAVDAGLELQLAVYALVVRAAGFTLAGTAYASLSDRATAQKSRVADTAPKTSFPHRGLFAATAIQLRDTTIPLPFKWTFNKDGTPAKRGDLKSPEAFDQILAGAADTVGQLATSLFAGLAAAAPNPAAKELPCDRCDVRAGCRI